MKIKSFETLLVAFYFFASIALTQAVKDACVIKASHATHPAGMIVAINR